MAHKIQATPAKMQPIQTRAPCPLERGTLHNKNLGNSQLNIIAWSIAKISPRVTRTNPMFVIIVVDFIRVAINSAITHYQKKF